MPNGSDFPIVFLKESHTDGPKRHRSETFDFIYMISGTLFITPDDIGETIEYGENSITVLYCDRSYLISGDKDTLFIHMGLRNEFLLECGLLDSQIICDTTLEPNRNYLKIRNLLTTISSQYLDISLPHRLSLYSLLYQLADLLVTDYSVSLNDALPNSGRYQERITSIRKYLYENYRQPITLNSLAASMYLTPQYLSKFFRQNFNQNFNLYLNRLRLQRAERDLVYSSKSITEIAPAHGFINIPTFNRNFKEHYGMSPREYRKKMQQKGQVSGPLPVLSPVPREMKLSEAAEPMHITAYITDGQPMKHNFSRLMNIGDAGCLKSEQFRSVLLQAARELGLTYIGLEGLVSNAMIPRLASDNDYYFNHLERTLDFLYGNRLIPFIMVGGDSFDYLNYAVKGEAFSHYSSSARFLKLFEAFLKFCSEHYDPAWISSWKFEFWKIPKAPDEEYFQGFASLKKLVNTYLPGAAFGGPGHILSSDSDRFLEVLKGFVQQGLQPDFVSVRQFMLKSVMADTVHPDLTAAVSDLRHQQRWILGQIRSIFGRDLPLYISEFNSALIPDTHIPESCFQAAFICRNLLEMHEDSDLIGYWMLADSSFGSDIPGLLQSGGFSLINRSGIPLPSYYAYRFLNVLGNTLIESGDNYCITKSEENHYQILCFNYAGFSNLGALAQNTYHSILDTYSYFESVSAVSLTFTLSGLASGCYRVRRSLLDRWHGSLTDLELGGFRYSTISESEYMYRIQTPGRNETAYLRSACVPEEHQAYLKVDSDLSCSIDLEPHAICLFDICLEL